MIILKADTNNATHISLPGVLKELQSTTSYIYFEFVNDMTKQVFFKELVPAAITARSFQFNINEPTNIDFKKQYGFYTYKIYESTDTGKLNSDDLQGDIVHIGKMHFSKTGVSEITYTEYTPTDTVNTTTKNTQYISI